MYFKKDDGFITLSRSVRLYTWGLSPWSTMFPGLRPNNNWFKLKLTFYSFVYIDCQVKNYKHTLWWSTKFWFNKKILWAYYPVVKKTRIYFTGQVKLPIKLSNQSNDRTLPVKLSNQRYLYLSHVLFWILFSITDSLT